MGFDFENVLIKENIARADYGIEKESLRINTDGSLAHTMHPFVNDHNIDRDFCENQIEIISDVFGSTDGLIKQLGSIHDYIYKTLRERNELLWSFSNPPKVEGEDDVPVAEFTGELKDKSLYREYLAKKYGKMKMLFSGIHFNFSFANDFMAQLSEHNGESVTECKNRVYLELAKKLVKYNWLIVYLTAASPVMDSSFIEYSGFGDGAANAYASVRCSKVGYWNEFIPILDYSSVPAYIDSVQKYIDAGKLKSISELYYPVRIKPRGTNSLEGLHELGINHVELRTIDLNPLSRIGIFKEDIEFFHLLMIYLMSLDDFEFDENSQIASILNIKRAAMYDNKNNFIEFGGGVSLPLNDAALSVINDIEKFVDKYVPEFKYAIQYQKAKLLDESKRYAFIIRKKYETDYVSKGIKLAERYENYGGEG